MAEIDDLQAAVEANTTVDESTKTLLAGLTAQIQQLVAANANSSDPALLAKVKAFADTLAANNASLSDAVAANTPAS